MLTRVQGWESFCGGISDGFARMDLGSTLMLHSLLFFFLILTVCNLGDNGGGADCSEASINSLLLQVGGRSIADSLYMALEQGLVSLGCRAALVSQVQTCLQHFGAGCIQVHTCLASRAVVHTGFDGYSC